MNVTPGSAAERVRTEVPIRIAARAGARQPCCIVCSVTLEDGVYCEQDGYRPAVTIR